jgi:hypothetical protein
MSLSVFQALGELDLACAFLRFGSTFTLWLWNREIEQAGIQTQTRNQPDRFLEPLTTLDQHNGGVTAIAKERDFSLWLPAPHLVDHEFNPLHKRAVTFVESGAGFLSQSQYCHKGQCPRTLAPGYRYQDRQTNPTNAQRFDHMLFGRQDWVSKPTFVFDLLASPSLQSFIDHQDQ